jgi:hypothetical protein
MLIQNSRRTKAAEGSVVGNTVLSGLSVRVSILIVMIVANDTSRDVCFLKYTLDNARI